MEKEGEKDIKPVKLGKIGKVKPKKAVMDTLPSPMGRRIVPKISSAVKNKAEGARKLFKDKVSFNVEMP